MEKAIKFMTALGLILTGISEVLKNYSELTKNKESKEQ